MKETQQLEVSKSSYEALRSALRYGLFIAVLMSACLGSVASVIDWRANPGGIFRDETGTYWGVVADTFLSWFMPAFWFCFLLAVPVVWIWRRRVAA